MEWVSDAVAEVGAGGRRGAARILGRVDDDAEADDMVWAGCWDFGDLFGVDAIGEEPGGGGAVGLAVVAHENGEEAGGGVVGEEQDGVAAGEPRKWVASSTRGKGRIWA